MAWKAPSRNASSSKSPAATQFCEHRQPIAADCEACGAALCERWCDFGPWVHFKELSTGKVPGGGIEWARHMYDTTFSPEYRVWQAEEWLPTAGAGVGYLLAADGAGSGSAEPPSADPAGAQRAPNGLVMPLQKLGAVLRRKHGLLRHACRDCMLGAAADAAGLIAAGEICQTPFCARKPEGSCNCCSAAFCQGCLTPGGYLIDGVACDHGSWPVIYSQASGRPDEVDMACGTREMYPPGGLCVPCACERIHALKAAATAAFEQDYAIRLARLSGQGGQPLFAVPAASRLTSGGRKKETRESREVAHRYAAEIAASAAHAVPAGRCRRSTGTSATAGLAPHTGYVLIGKPASGQAPRKARKPHRGG